MNNVRARHAVPQQKKEITVKKFFSRLFSCVAIVAAIAFLAPAPAHAAEGVPTVVSLALPGGTSNIGTNVTPVATLNYSNLYVSGFTADARSSFRPQSYQYAIGGTLIATGTVTLARSAGGPVFATITIASNALSSVSFEANAWYFFRGDVIYAKASFTNAGTFSIVSSPSTP